ncbi:MAG: hypothetical protein ACPGTU_17310, partial [Myxococcota bacterium]
MKTFFCLFIFCSLLFASPARAECSGAYTVDSLSTDLGAMGEKLRGGDEAGFTAIGLNTEKQLGCIDAPMAPVILANLYRSIGLSHFFHGDADLAKWWFRTALELDPSFEWGVGELAADHPVRDVFSQERNSAVADKIPESGGRSLAIPDGGRILVDG